MDIFWEVVKEDDFSTIERSNHIPILYKLQNKESERYLYIIGSNKKTQDIALSLSYLMLETDLTIDDAYRNLALRNNTKEIKLLKLSLGLLVNIVGIGTILITDYLNIYDTMISYNFIKSLNQNELLKEYRVPILYHSNTRYLILMNGFETEVLEAGNHTDITSLMKIMKEHLKIKSVMEYRVE